MKKTIPQIEILICDRCGAEDDRSRPQTSTTFVAKQYNSSNPFYSGELHMYCRDRLTGPLGESAGGEKSYDLCYKCMLEFYEWMKSNS